MMLKYETAYFCGYAKLPSALATTVANGMLTLGMKIHLETADIEAVSVTLISKLANSMVESYFVGRNLLKDFDDMVEEIAFRHQGNAQKSLIKALGDIRRNYIDYMSKKRPLSQRRGEKTNKYLTKFLDILNSLHKSKV